MVDDYDVGDVATFALTVNPASSDTEATIRIVDPAGTVVPATPSSNTGRSRWTANVTLTSPGVWEATWSVTGTGAGRQSTEVRVRPEADAPIGRSYATTGELAAYLRTAPPANAARVLPRATEVIDDLLLGGYWELTEDGMPSDTRVAAALRQAVCAQVEWWRVNGDPDGLGATQSWNDVAIGSVKLSRGQKSDQQQPDEIAPVAVRALRAAGLLPIRPWVVG
jgi:hypothetical protein